MMIYGFTFGIGSLVFTKYSQAVVLLGFAMLGTFLVWNRSISKLNKTQRTQTTQS
jgi:Na+/proline symporter